MTSKPNHFLKIGQRQQVPSDQLVNSDIKMGKPQSKVSQNTGDPQVQVLNQLELHEEYHASHDMKLTIILVVVCAQLAIAIYRMYQKHSKKQAVKAAKSIANIKNIV